MRVLVTGGAGFVGSHIADRLMEAGHEVVVLDDLSSGQNHCPKGAELVRRDLATLGESDAPKLLDYVVHAAAYPELRHNWHRGAEERNRLKRANIDATMRLLEVFGSLPVLMLGTASVYGSRPGYLCWEEDAEPWTLESPYAATKFAAEGLLAAWAHFHRTPWHVLRLVNVVGARTHRGVISDFVRMMRADGRIHAADDGSQRKSWIHVLDVADAVEAVLSGRVPNGVYNCTSNERISWWDVVKAMRVPREKITHELRRFGAVGDPVDLHVSGGKLLPYWRAKLCVMDGIHDALRSLEWGTKEPAVESGWSSP